MADPTTTTAALATGASSVSLAAFATLWLGPNYGPYVAILFAAMAGAIWGVSGHETTSRLQGAGYFFRYTITAMVLVGGGTVFAGSYLGGAAQSPVDLSVLVAFVIAAIGGRWKAIIARIDPTKLLRTKGDASDSRL